MQAARAYEGERNFRLETVPIPEIADGEVLVRVGAAGITHGLLSLWRSGRVKLLPATLGQEIAGTVVETGARAGSWKAGDRVRVHPTLSCRACEFCMTDREMMCPSVALIGHAIYSPAAMPLYERYHNGGLAEYVRAPHWSLDPLPDGISTDVASRVHSMGVAYRALRKAQLRPGSTLVVNAATGAAGSSVVKFARLYGVRKVIAVARNRANLERLHSWDPDLVEMVSVDELAPGWEERDGLLNRIHTLTQQEGADALVDFMPVPSPATSQAIRGLRRGGTAVLTGGNRGDLSGLRYTDIMGGGWRIEGNRGYARRDAIEILRVLAAGTVNVDALITHRLTLAEAPRAVELIDERTEGVIYAVIQPGPAS